MNKTQFLRKLQSEGGKIDRGSFLVEGFFDINARDLHLNNLSLSGLTFTGGVRVIGFSGNGCIRIDGSNFLDNLLFEANVIRHFVLSDTSAPNVMIWNTKAQCVTLRGLTVKGELDLSGLKVASFPKGGDPPILQLQDVTFERLSLMHVAGLLCVKVPVVVTDDQVAAEQFRMFSVPVIMSTSAVRQRLANMGSDEAILPVAAGP